MGPRIPVGMLLLWLLATGPAVAVRQQAVGVTGQLKCGDAPAANVRVKLFDEDSGPDPDDELAAGYTDSSGRFSLEGSTVEMTNIDAVFKVYHDCNDGLMPGHRKVRFKIPNSYVSNGKTPKKKFDLGVINLEVIFAEENRELIVSRRRKRQLLGPAGPFGAREAPREFGRGSYARFLQEMQMLGLKSAENWEFS